MIRAIVFVGRFIWAGAELALVFVLCALLLVALAIETKKGEIDWTR